MTKAELKRRLVPGTKLTLVNCLMGPCNKHRTVQQVRSSEFVMSTPEGSDSYLPIGSDEYVEATENGFKIIIKGSGRIAAEYQWDHMYNHVGKV